MQSKQKKIRAVINHQLEQNTYVNMSCMTRNLKERKSKDKGFNHMIMSYVLTDKDYFLKWGKTKIVINVTHSTKKNTFFPIQIIHFK